MYDEQIFSLQNVPASVTFNVDEGIGQDITVTVISEAVSDLNLAIAGPNGFLHSNATSNVKTWSLSIPGISEVSLFFLTCKLCVFNMPNL